jgi:V-type H+-transporting ATPase subunit A
LTVGDPILRTGAALSVELGPGLCAFLLCDLTVGIVNNIFDGIQRPLDAIQKISNSIYIPRGLSTQALDRHKKWHFIPAGFKIGDQVSGGDIIGTVRENNIITHRIMVNPKARGEITWIGEAGEYTCDVRRTTDLTYVLRTTFWSWSLVT